MHAQRAAPSCRHPDFHKELAILEFTEELWRVMQEQSVSGTELGGRIGSSQAYISRVLNGGANFTLATMTKLAMGLGMELKIHLAPADAFTVWRDVLVGSPAGSSGGRVVMEATLTQASAAAVGRPRAAAYAETATTRRTDYTATIDDGERIAGMVAFLGPANYGPTSVSSLCSTAEVLSCATVQRNSAPRARQSRLLA